MSKILVCGLTNMETTVKVGQFPVEYMPIDYNFFGVNSAPSGVGLNLALSLSTLCDEVKLLSMVGKDSAGVVVRNELENNGVSTEYLLDSFVTAQSVVLYDEDGRRRIFCDLKDFQDKSFDEELFVKAAKDCDVLCLCNINYSRSLLKIAKDMNKKIACDVHVLSNIYDEYNRDYMENADVLFLSNEAVVGNEQEFLSALKDVYGCEIFVVGMGEKGALMYVRDDDVFYTVDAVKTQKVVNTVGAGDALFSSFVHFYAQGVDPYKCLKLATIYASNKIGENGASKGFISEKELLTLAKQFNV